MCKLTNRRIVLWSAGLCILITLVSTAGCDAVTSVHGVVVDEGQRPVSGALVRLVRVQTGQTEESNTRENGSYLVTIIHGPFAGRFTLTISKQGYATYHQEI